MSERFGQFRKRYSCFNYTEVNCRQSGDGLTISFAFDIDNLIYFRPSLRIPKPIGEWAIDPLGEPARRLAFYVGMVELISYWKAFCPPNVKVLAANLCEDEITWWKKLYFLGLGEFFYVNEIRTTASEFLSLEAPIAKAPIQTQFPSNGGSIIPVGGGKDSVVTLELLRSTGQKSYPLLIQAPSAAKHCCLLAGYSPHRIIEIDRTLDPALLELNAKGALNGHTPFSALVAFVSLFTAALTGGSYIVLSNESSADEPTILGSTVNHQYSKSFEFENDFRSYVGSFVTSDIEYFSFLRPLNELQIASIFSSHSTYLSHFRSCNVGSRSGLWCGRCAKCLFTFVILQPFLEVNTLVSIFGRDLLSDPALMPLLADLLGCSDAKPFECVGTVSEVRVAISMILAQNGAGVDTKRLLLRAVRANYAAVLVPEEVAKTMLCTWNIHNNVPERFKRFVERSLLFT